MSSTNSVRAYGESSIAWGVVATTARKRCVRESLRARCRVAQNRAPVLCRRGILQGACQDGRGGSQVGRPAHDSHMRYLIILALVATPICIHGDYARQNTPDWYVVFVLVVVFALEVIARATRRPMPPALVVTVGPTSATTDEQRGAVVDSDAIAALMQLGFTRRAATAALKVTGASGTTQEQVLTVLRSKPPA